MSKEVDNDLMNDNNINNNFNQDNSFSSFIFNSYNNYNQEYNEEDDLDNKMDNLSINDAINNINDYNKNINLNKSKNSSINISISNNSNKDLTESKSTQFSSIINFTLSTNAEKIYEHLYENKFKIKNSIIISDEEEINREIYIKLIEDFYNNNTKNNIQLDKNMNKICFLSIDSKKVDKLYEKLNEVYGSQKKVMILQGGKGKKMKNDYNKFTEFVRNIDIFIAIPDVFYKLLSIGFIKIYQFSLLFIDDCHLCEGNHPYNSIMQEFYYYYFYREKYLNIKNSFKLPNILGFTTSSFSDKKTITNDSKYKQSLINISENLDCQIIISPKLFYNSFDEKNEDVYIEYIQVESHLKDKNNYTNLYKILSHYFVEKMIKLCLNSFLTQNKNKNLFVNKEQIKSIAENYLHIINKKFFSTKYEEYVKIEANEKNLPFFSQNSYIFSIFEEMQKYLVIIMQNLDVQGIINIFYKYLNLYQNFLNQKKIEDNIVINEIKYLIGIIKDCINAFEHLLKKNFNYQNDRLNKFSSYLNKIYSKNKDIKTIIFVPTRKLAYVLNEYINRNNFYKSEYIAGVNIKKEEYLYLSLTTKITNNVLTERIKGFNEGDTNILICTPSVYENLEITKCDYIIIFNELSNSNWDYTRIKNLAMNNKSNLIIFTLNENNIKNYFMKKIIENDRIMIFFEQNDIMKDFRGKNYLEEKLENIKKQNYYIIEETQAKVSMRNSMMIFNVINNWFLQQNKKLIIVKFIDEYFIDKVKKYKCKIELNEMFGSVKIFSHTYGDKQASEFDCYLQLISFLHKIGIIDNNLKIKDK